MIQTGRPKAYELDPLQIAEARALHKVMGVRSVAKKIGVSERSVRRAFGMSNGDPPRKALRDKESYTREELVGLRPSQFAGRPDRPAWVPEHVIADRDRRMQLHAESTDPNVLISGDPVTPRWK